MSSSGNASQNLIYRAFISYSRSDREVAIALQSRLEGYVLPEALRQISPGLRRDARPLKPVFRDEDELVPGQDLPERILAGLRGAQYLIVVCSPNAAKSEWVEKEILEFAAMGKTDDILAVVADGEPRAAERRLTPELECLPAALRFQLETPEGAESAVITDRPVEPLWVDWRGGARKDRTMFLRVVAALLSLARFDELVHRDARVRLRQRVLWGTMAGVALVLFASLGAAVVVQTRNVQVQNLDRQLLDQENSARAAYDQRDFQTAASEYEKDAELAQQLIKLDGSTLQWRLNLATSYVDAANTLKMEGMEAVAVQQSRLALAAAAELAKRDQNDPTIRAKRQTIQAMMTVLATGSKPLSSALAVLTSE